MRQVTLIDLPIVVGIFEHIHGEQEILPFYLRSKIKNPFENVYMLDDTNSFLLIFERIGVAKCQFHVYPSPDAKKIPLKEKKKHLLEAIKYVKEQGNYTSIITFIPKGNREAELSAKILGLTLIGELENAGGIGCTERIYSFNEVK